MAACAIPVTLTGRGEDLIAVGIRTNSWRLIRSPATPGAEAGIPMGAVEDASAVGV